MKPKVFLLLSVALNLILVLYIVRLGPAEEPPEEVAPVVESESATVRQTAPETSPSASTPARTFNWEVVESPDYREYIANLRAIGCPEETIRDIIVADVNKLYAAKKREVQGDPEPFEYWKAGNPLAGQFDPDYLAGVRALEEEKLAVLRQLGIEPDASMLMSSMSSPVDVMSGMFGFLPEEKQLGVVRIMQEMQDDMVGATDDMGADRGMIMDAQNRIEDKIRALLSPEEFRDYELRMSATANTLRAQLAGWDPDEQEFLEVYELRKAFDDEFGAFGFGSTTEADQQERQAAQEQLNAALQEVLGEEHYDDYTRAQDYSFQQIHQSVTRAGLGTDEAIQAYDMRSEALAEAERVWSNPDLTPEQQRVAVEGVQAETERSLREVLGEEGWDQYDRGYNTAWLNRMVPPAAP